MHIEYCLQVGLGTNKIFYMHGQRDVNRLGYTERYVKMSYEERLKEAEGFAPDGTR